MNKWKALAVLFTLLTMGAVQETFRIFTSAAPDIADNRKGLMPFSVIMTGLFLFLAIRFWKKAANSKRL
jgi:hypothetical protein